jgi:hypothetical protein
MKLHAMAIALCGLLAAGCAYQELGFALSPVLPAAYPNARIRQDVNENQLVEIEIEHMAPPGHLSPPRSVYVVWAEGDEGRILPLGQLRVGEDREGHFRGVTALERFRILISAEIDPQATQPSQPYMLVSDFVDRSER